MKKPNIKPRAVVKFAVTTVAAAGITTIVKEVVKNNVAPENTYAKVGVIVGTVALTSIISLHTKKYVGDQIDSVLDAASNIKKLAEEQSAVNQEV